jgi:hypothetical protein
MSATSRPEAGQGPAVCDYYGAPLEVGDFVKVAGDRSAIRGHWELEGQLGTVTEISGDRIGVTVAGTEDATVLAAAAVVLDGARPALGDVRRSPDKQHVAIFQGYRATWPGRPWHADGNKVFRPQDVRDWTPMQEVR